MTKAFRMAASSRWAKAVCAAAVALLVLASAAGAATGAAKPGPVCKDYSVHNRVSVLGGHPFAVKKPLKDVADLQALWQGQAAEIKSILEANGLGQLADQLAAAVAAGKVEMRDMAPGDTLNWMVYRTQKGQPAKLIKPVCFSAAKPYPAFLIPIEVFEGPEPVDAVCKMSASGDGATKTLSVDITGSTAGGHVTMKGPGGEQEIIAAGGSTYSGKWVKRYLADYEFTESVPGPKGKRTIHRYDFVVPVACGNVAFAGETTRVVDWEGKPCSKTEQVARLIPPDPSAQLAVTPQEVFRGQAVSYKVTGHWDTEHEGDVTDPLVVTANRCGGQEVLRSTNDSGSQTFPKIGPYTFHATAKNEIGKSADATAVDILVKARWTLRGFGVYANPNSNSVFSSVTRPGGSTENTDFKFDSDWGLGVSGEYHFTDLIGLEGAAILANFKGKFLLDESGTQANGSDKSQATILTVGPNFHFTPKAKVDFYAGVFLAYADIGSQSFNLLGTSQSRSFGSAVGPGALLGLDVPFGPCNPWGLHFGLRYVDPKIDVTGGPSKEKIKVTPWLGEFGFAFRF